MLPMIPKHYSPLRARTYQYITDFNCDNYREIFLWQSFVYKKTIVWVIHSNTYIKNAIFLQYYSRSSFFCNIHRNSIDVFRKSKLSHSQTHKFTCNYFKINMAAILTKESIVITNVATFNNMPCSQRLQRNKIGQIDLNNRP